MKTNVRFEQILGIRFFVGEAEQAIAQVEQNGGLVVVPSGPGMRTLVFDVVYRQALLGADLAIADSAFMVLLWNLQHSRWIKKLSGLKYLRALVNMESFRRPGGTFWVMPSQESAQRNVQWLRRQGIEIAPENIYIAPQYNGHYEDPSLVDAIERRRPRHVIMGVGGNVQEPLGYYLKTHLSYLPAIHCIGAAIGFLSGDQVHIPVWTDKLGLGWLWRVVSNPRRYFPRYWEARHLAHMMFWYRERLPVE